MLDQMRYYVFCSCAQDSPRGEADGQSFIFPIIHDDHSGEIDRRNSLFIDPLQVGCGAGDSGIDSIQASPSPNAFACLPGSVVPATPTLSSPTVTPPSSSPTPSLRDNTRRASSALLHPDHARLMALRNQQTSPDQV